MIDSRAVIHPKAELASNVEVGPFAVIGPDVVIGEDSWIAPHVVINGPTRIGRQNKIFQFASVGEIPQDKKYSGEPTGSTRIGSDNWIMAYVHIAHDCHIGDHTIFANNASLAGHVTIEDHVILGGFSQVHQFCSLGAHCFTAFGSGIAKDVPPYVMVSGHPAEPHGINVEGLRRRGFSAETLTRLRRAYKTLYRANLTLKDAIAQLKEQIQECPEIGLIVDFLEKSTRGIVR